MLIVDGVEYEIESIKIRFTQSADFKGQPQGEVKGGQISIMITQLPDDTLYEWAKHATKQKEGQVLFKSEAVGTMLEIVFENAYCVKLARNINASSGTRTSLVIAPERLYMAGVKHDNRWRNK